MTEREFCGRCEFNEPEVKGLCRTCYTYRYRTGKDRPRHLIERQYRLNVNRPPAWVKRALQILDTA